MVSYQFDHYSSNQIILFLRLKAQRNENKTITNQLHNSQQSKNTVKFHRKIQEKKIVIWFNKYQSQTKETIFFQKNK